MTNINNGGRTPVAGIVHAVVLLLILLFLMPLAQYIPMACLAGVLIVVCLQHERLADVPGTAAAIRART